jgi:hypothetical protein
MMSSPEKVIIKTMQIDQESKTRPRSDRSNKKSAQELLQGLQLDPPTPNDIRNQTREFEEPSYEPTAKQGISGLTMPDLTLSNSAPAKEKLPFKEFVQFAKSRKALYRLMAFKSKSVSFIDLCHSEALPASIPPLHDAVLDAGSAGPQIRLSVLADQCLPGATSLRVYNQASTEGL